MKLDARVREVGYKIEPRKIENPYAQMITVFPWSLTLRMDDGSELRAEGEGRSFRHARRMMRSAARRRLTWAERRLLP